MNDDSYKEDTEIENDNKKEFTDIDTETRCTLIFPFDSSEINLNSLYSDSYEKRSECLFSICNAINSGYAVSEIPVNHLYKIFDFISNQHTKEEGIYSFSILRDFLKLDHETLIHLYHPHILELLIDIVDNTLIPDFLILSFECIESFISHKKLIMELGTERDSIFILILHGFEAVGSRFPISCDTDQIISATFNVAKIAIQTFSDSINNEYKELKNDTEFVIYSFYSDFIYPIIEYGQKYIEYFPFVVLSFLSVFFKELTPLAVDNLSNQQFLSNIYECAYQKTPACDQLLFEITYIILKNEPPSSIFILNSPLINNFAFYNHYDNEIIETALKTLQQLIAAFLEIFHSYDNQDDIKQCQDLIDKNWIHLSEETYSVLISSSYNLKSKACFLLCTMLEIGNPISNMIVDNCPDLLSEILELLQGKDKELDYAIIRAIQQIMYVSDKEAQENESQTGVSTCNKYLNYMINDLDLQNRISEITDMWLDDDKLNCAITMLKSTFEQSLNFAEIDGDLIIY